MRGDAGVRIDSSVRATESVPPSANRTFALAGSDPGALASMVCSFTLNVALTDTDAPGTVGVLAPAEYDHSPVAGCTTRCR